MRTRILSAFALMLALSICLVPGAMAASSSGTSVYLYDTGNAAPDATCDWYTKVAMPPLVYSGEALAIDVTMVLHNGTGLAVNGVYTVSVTISDGTTGITSEVDITTATAKTGEIVFTDVALATLADTTAGTMTVSLLDSTDATLDTYVIEGVTINADRASGSVNWFAGLMISMLAVLLVLVALGGLSGKLGGILKR